jgi:hypothetical protein
MNVLTFGHHAIERRLQYCEDVVRIVIAALRDNNLTNQERVRIAEFYLTMIAQLDDCNCNRQEENVT